MLGFVIGTVSLIALIKVLRGRRRWHHRHHGRGWGCGYTSHCGPNDCDDYGERGWRDYRGGEPPWSRGDDEGGPVLLRGLFSRLNATPGQERTIIEAFRELKSAVRQAAEAKAKGAKEIAEAMRGDDFKTENMGEAFVHLDGASETVRDATFTALAKIHAVLDERQRKILADIIARGGRALEDFAQVA
jgi:hypothetical protein